MEETPGRASLEKTGLSDPSTATRRRGRSTTTTTTTKTVKKLQFDLLRTDDEYTTQFQRHISEHMEGINTIDNVQDRYIKFRNALTESAQ